MKKNILCKIFGHNWMLFKRDVINKYDGKYIRSCKRCNKLQEYKLLPSLPFQTYYWVNLVQYTKLYSKKLINDLKDGEKIK